MGAIAVHLGSTIEFWFLNWMWGEGSRRMPFTRTFTMLRGKADLTEVILAVLAVKLGGLIYRSKEIEVVCG